jgi:hypothetical protein
MKGKKPIRRTGSRAKPKHSSGFGAGAVLRRVAEHLGIKLSGRADNWGPRWARIVEMRNPKPEVKSRRLVRKQIGPNQDTPVQVFDAPEEEVIQRDIGRSSRGRTSLRHRRRRDEWS